MASVTLTSSSGSYTIPASLKYGAVTFDGVGMPLTPGVYVYCHGGGGAGGSLFNTTTTVRRLATGGGGGAKANYVMADASYRTSTVAYTIGAGGTATTLTAAGAANGGNGGETFWDGVSYAAAVAGAGGGSGGTTAVSTSSITASGGAGGSYYKPNGSVGAHGGDIGSVTANVRVASGGGGTGYGSGGPDVASTGITTSGSGGAGLAQPSGGSGSAGVATSTNATASASTGGAPGGGGGGASGGANPVKGGAGGLGSIYLLSNGYDPSPGTVTGISGTLREGQVLTINSSGWTNIGDAPYHRITWYRGAGTGGTVISDTGSMAGIPGSLTYNYTATSSDVGSIITGLVRAWDTTSGGSSWLEFRTTSEILPSAPSISSSSISGSSIQGSILTASVSYSSTRTDLYPVTVAYDWRRNGSSIGATSSTYQLTNADIGTTVTCYITVSNVTGSASSTPSGGLVARRAPVNTAAPTISGSASEGSTLTCSTGSWEADSTYYSAPTSYSYQWYSGGSPVGTNSNQYITGSGDVSKQIYCTVTATNANIGGGATAVNTSSTSTIIPAAPVITGSSISGTTTQANVLTASVSYTASTAGGLYPVTVTYQWKRDGSDIGSATSSTYSLTNSDVGTIISCYITVSNAAYGGGTVSTTPTKSPNYVLAAVPSYTSAPSISGTATQGSTLTCSTGTWRSTDSTYYYPRGFTYQWKRGGSIIVGATSSTYALTGSDVGYTITCTVVALNGSASYSAGDTTVTTSGTSTVAVRAPVNASAPTISGTTQVSQTLTSTSGSWTTDSNVYYSTPSDYLYQWNRNGSAISGATSSTYVLQPADAGTTISVTVTARIYDSYYSTYRTTSSTSSSTGTILAAAAFFMLF